MSMLRSLSFLLLAVTSASASPIDEAVEVSSHILSDEAFLRGLPPDGAPVALTGRLTGPPGEGRRPVVLLLHGTDGPRSGAAGSWRRILNDAGILTFRLDSYTGRRLAQASTAQDSFPQFSQIYDLYRAADELARHPAVDGSRIAVMGFSRGGNAALYGAMARFHESYGPETATIVAYLPFYPACNIDLVRGDEMVDRPIRQFHGDADDWTPVAPCMDLFRRLQSAGADASLTVYPGALHGFDNVGNPSLFSDPDAQTSRDCQRREIDGVLVNVATGKPFTYADACVATGPSSKYNPAAADAARTAVLGILAEAFAER